MPNVFIRTMAESDIDLIVSYWHQCSDADLLRMGVDKNKLPSTQKLAAKLASTYQLPSSETGFSYRFWMIDNKTVGYSVLKHIKENIIADIHLHLFESEFRGHGYGKTLFCLSVIDFYRAFNLKIILCEPCSSNLMPNRMLEKIGFEKWKTYISAPAEIALTGEVNSYLISEEKALAFLKKIICNINLKISAIF